MSKITAGIALIYCLAKLGDGLWYVTHPNPFDLPGQTWELSFGLSSVTIRLLDSGKYVFYHWCDICDPVDSESGSWFKTGNTLTLAPDYPATRKKSFTLSQVGACKYLVPASGSFKNQLFYSLEPEHQHCGHGL